MHNAPFDSRENRRSSAPKLIIASILIAAISAGIWLYTSAGGSQFKLSQVPAYSGTPYYEINDNVPFFTEQDLKRTVFEEYSPLDSLGRCGPAFAMLGLELMPEEERESIQSIYPTGWHTRKYSFIEGEYLYNRCHLIAFMLAGENANERNLITGTRYMNVEGMLPFERRVAKYIELSGDNVLYRVTPVFKGKNLLASGVLMEALSIGDGGENICFNVFVYNVQPGIEINYKDGW